MTPLEVGQEAPDFTLRDEHGAEVRLSSYRDDSSVALVFFPSAFSPVCSGELAGLQARWAELARPGLQVLGVSTDPLFTLRTFAEQEGLEFPLLTDFWPHGAVCTAYGVLDEQFGSAARSTFLVDREGVIRWAVHHAMPDARSIEELLAAADRIAG